MSRPTSIADSITQHASSPPTDDLDRAVEPTVVVDDEEVVRGADITDSQIEEILRTSRVIGGENRIGIMCRTALNESLRGTQIQEAARRECAQLWDLRASSGWTHPAPRFNRDLVDDDRGQSIDRSARPAHPASSEVIALRRRVDWRHDDLDDDLHELDAQFDQTQFAEHERELDDEHPIIAPRTIQTPRQSTQRTVPVANHPAVDPFEPSQSRPLAIGFAPFPCPMCHLPITAQDAHGSLRIPQHRIQTPSFPFGHAGPMFRVECPASLMQVTQVCDGDHLGPPCDDQDCWRMDGQANHQAQEQPRAQDGIHPSAPLIHLVSAHLHSTPGIRHPADSPDWGTEDETSEVLAYDPDRRTNAGTRT